MRDAFDSWDATSRDTVSQRIDREAAEWLSKIDRDLTDAEEIEFLEWLEGDSSHRRAMQELQESWMLCDKLSQWKPEFSSDPNPSLLARPNRKHITRRDWFRWGGAAALVALSGTALWTWSNLSGGSPSTMVLQSSDGARSYERFVLEDGSVVEMNSGARVEVTYSPEARRLTLLAGEAHFTVEHDAQRPFLVSAAGLQVRALGTAFNVRLSDSDIEVMVTQGKVRVAPSNVEEALAAEKGQPNSMRPDKPNNLVAGQKTVIAKQLRDVAPTVSDFSLEEVEERLSWRSEILQFSSTPLKEVVEAFNRRNFAQLVIVDAALSEVRINAAVNPSKLRGFLRMLQYSAGIQAEITDAGAILLRQPTGAR